MQGSQKRPILGLVVAFLLAGAVVVFGLAVVANWLGLPSWAMWLVVIAGLALLAWPLFFARSENADSTGSVNQKEDGRMPGSPLVAIVMGSKSDAAVMQECADTLEALGVPFEMLVASAHRQPERVHEWATGLAGRGVKVVVAAAGKAAHLAGVVAAYTTLPVIAVPMRTSDLGGLDSLLSTVQMPSGVPVACVAINGAKNAAILATQVLATSMPVYAKAVEALKREMAED